MTYLSNIARSEGDPKVLSAGPSSLATADKLAKALGWFSIGLGLTELLGARRLTRALGMEGHETLVRAYGAREIGSGIMALSTEKRTGLWSRVAGDGLDIATLMTAMRPDNPKRDNVGIALAMVVGVTLLDIAAAQAFSVRHSRGRGRPRSYKDRTGFPQGVHAARGAARDFRLPKDMRAAPALAAASSPPAEERSRIH
jgi:hypothetical protein